MTMVKKLATLVFFWVLSFVAIAQSVPPNLQQTGYPQSNYPQNQFPIGPIKVGNVNANELGNTPSCAILTAHDTETFFWLSKNEQAILVKYCPNQAAVDQAIANQTDQNLNNYDNEEEAEEQDQNANVRMRDRGGNYLDNRRENEPQQNNNFGTNPAGNPAIDLQSADKQSQLLNQFQNVNGQRGTTGTVNSVDKKNSFAETPTKGKKKSSDLNAYFSKFGLKPFGYDMFKSATTALVPGTDLPTPDTYKLAPGDTITIETYGQMNRTYRLPIEHDGSVNVPDLGPVALQGLDVGSAKSILENRVKSSMLGTSAKVSVTELHSARVLVLGDAERPGSYVLTGVPNVTAALFASGGVKDIGSLRKVELRRDGKVVRKLDTYAELLMGDTSNDLQVLPGDAVLIPTIGATVGVAGEVLRPAVYEILNERTIGDVIKLSGGFSPGSDPSHATIDRIVSGKNRTIDSIDLTREADLQKPINAGDLITIPPIVPYLANQIEVTGAVLRPIVRAYAKNIHLVDVLPSLSDLKKSADSHYVLVRRIDQKTKIISTISTDLDMAIKAPTSKFNIELQPEDTVVVFDRFHSRGASVNTYIRELQRQSSPNEPARVFTINGQVNASGTYPLDSNMHFSDALRAGGGLKDSAYRQTAELTRYQMVNGEKRVVAVSRVDLQSILDGNAEADVTLQPYDLINIQVTPGWFKTETVELVGEFKFPGKYVITPGETLATVIKRAGGYTDRAFLRGAIFTREDLRMREQEQKNKLMMELRANVTAQTQSPDKSNAMAAAAIVNAQTAIEQLSAVEPLGRMVIDLDELAKMGRLSNRDVTLRDKDKLVVPRKTEEIMILGEVQNPTAIVYHNGLTKKEAIGDAGGFTRRADKSAAYVIRANGQVINKSGSMFSINSQNLEPGDSVIVPTNLTAVSPMVEWASISQMVFQFAATAASLKTIGIL